jgi:cell division protease FtsH
LAARRRTTTICQRDLDEAVMRVIAGPERKTRVMSDRERRITAYHEMGHAIVGHYLPNADPVHKISVISRGQALGYTISLPTEDKFLTTRAELLDTMAMTLGGRAAEEIVFGEVTTGASNDLEKVTATAKQMVMRFGMSEKLGPRVFGHDQGQPFVGREFSAEPDYSDEIAREIDDEIRLLVESAHAHATDILTTHRSSLEKLSEILIKRETIEREQFEALLDGESEEQLFGRDGPPSEPAPPQTAPSRRRRKRQRPLPRPGFAGGTAALARAASSALTAAGEAIVLERASRIPSRPARVRRAP